MPQKHWLLLAAGLIATLAAAPTRARDTPRETPRGTIVTGQLASKVLADNLIGLDANRAIKVYLPPGYAGSGQRYPVVYFLHNIFWSPRQTFEDGNLQRLLEHGMATGVTREFIFVAADYSGPTTGSLYENSPVSGRWLDYTVGEVVPFIDAKFRTLPRRESRAVVGDFFGGRGALQLAMTHADVFGVAYAMHPVATGNGDIPWVSLEIDWPRMFVAKTFAELAGGGRTQIFWAIQQAFSPNPARPPCFCDFFMQMENGVPRANVEVMRNTQKAFMLDGTLDASTANLRSMRGVAFDWGRFDTTQAHVIANRQFSRMLEDLGVEHEAEEYRGDPWNRTWTEHGRFATRVLPFMNRHLLFSP